MPISCLSWIPKGIARSHPTKSKYSPESLLKLAREDLNPAVKKYSGNVETLELNGSVQAEADIDKELSEYNLQDYDQDEVCDLYKLNPYEDNIIDPSISQFDTESEGSSDIIIGPHDNLAVVGVTNNNANALEIYLYNYENGDWYIHHDIPVNACPLCVESLDCSCNENDLNGNLVAVGTKASFIEIWDIDNINCLQPVATLGNASNLTDDNLRRIKSPLKSHNDSVLDLSWNRSARTILASASADQAVILWDITLAKTSNIYSHHSDKVQSIQWHPFEAQLLLTSSTDKTIQLTDCRIQESAIRWNTANEIEKVIWNPFCPAVFLVGLYDGSVYAFDVRNRDYIFRICAHNMSITDLALSYQTEGLLVTSSIDKTVKVWDITGNTPKFISSKNLNIGKVYCSCFCPDNASIMFGGEKNSVSLVDLNEEFIVYSHFRGKKSSSINLN
ncbi:Periodic tryptophan protein 1-like protein [Trichoplax sp. H2]|nr:Periodic tryptophan protein 1-like protein [Trichoplax sp. H2]|eukprot:RDD41182.1 Periodic tryptophan protein 1-like protein [Trichoplax sp. H2]